MTTDLVPSEHGELSATLFGSSDPAAALAQMTAVASTLADVVRKQNLVVRIQSTEHVRVEGWTFLGSLLGVFPVVVWTHPVLEDSIAVGWEARVEARTRAGEIVGAAEAECLRAERSWKGRDDYALRSMAQTRAVSKALRLPLGFVMQLAGFNPTPAEEMVIEGSVGEPSAGYPSAPAPGVSGESAQVPSPADVPFGYDIDAPILPAGSHADKKPSAAMLKKLNVLVGKLRPEHLSTLELWQGMKREPVASEDGLLHWSPLRDSLTFSEAMQLIDRLEKFAAKVEAA